MHTLMSYCLNMIVLISFPFKVLNYCDELSNSIFMYIILPIMDDTLLVGCKSNTPVETLIKFGTEFSSGFWSVFKEGNLMTLVSSDNQF